VSQNNIDQGQAAETPSQETKTFIQQVRVSTRRKYAPEDKILIVREGFRIVRRHSSINLAIDVATHHCSLSPSQPFLYLIKNR